MCCIMVIINSDIANLNAAQKVLKVFKPRKNTITLYSDRW